MEMVSIPLVSLNASVEYFEAEIAYYQEKGDVEMLQWCLGRLSAIKSLLETWHTV